MNFRDFLKNGEPVEDAATPEVDTEEVEATAEVDAEVDAETEVEATDSEEVTEEVTEDAKAED